MAINLNTDPYFDDFDETKNYHQILFKPGVSVQARELTQLQSIIKNQIKRFGDHIFKNGTLVHGGNATLDLRYNCVKLAADANDSVLSLIDTEVYGTESGQKALVVNATQADSNGNPPTIYVKWLNSTNNKESVGFSPDEAIYNTGKSVRVFAAAAQVNTVGSAYIISEGIMYVNGHFVYFPDSTLVLSRTGKPGSVIVGFDVEEKIYTYTDDNTLLDPANGSYNYAAPGADRLYIDMTMARREFIQDSVADPNYIEIARIQTNQVVSQAVIGDYALLGDVLARRTYDESGDYVVRQYSMQLLEHLDTGSNNGYYDSNRGGDSSKFIAKINPGKAYVKGYEIDSIKNQAIAGDKARDTAAVDSGSVYVPYGNYVFASITNSFPEDLDDLPLVRLYDSVGDSASPAAAQGNQVGTARIRHVEQYTSYLSAGLHKIFLFDIQMFTGKSFARDAKQIWYNNTTASDFTADIDLENTLLQGTISATNSSTAVTGNGTSFTTDLNEGDYIEISGDYYKIATITDDLNLTLDSNYLGVTISGEVLNVGKAVIKNPEKNSYIFPLPADIIKTVDANGTDTIYSVRRVYTRTLAAGIAGSLNANTDESFNSYSYDNWQAYDSQGAPVDLGLATLTFSGNNTVVDIDLSGAGYTTETIFIVGTVQKTNAPAAAKNKVLQTNSQKDVLTQGPAQANTISLGKADGYRLVSVKMTTSGAFGDPSYDNTTEIDITNRYDFSNGQKAFYYDRASITLKKGAAAPTAPIRITFDYFTHTSGDFFTVDSYSDIAYDDIPTLTLGGNQYVLRDCLDFRPRINDAGTGFSGTGASVGEFLDYEDDISTSYEYYLPRVDKVVLTNKGRIRIIKGKSDLEPKEPKTPTDSMVLYLLKQNAYVFDLKADIKVINIDNKRYTMRAIGNLEKRIKNLEYYTTLNQIEQDTQNYQIKDINGLDRFKNGFIVDSFTGHGVGDVYREDYRVAIDKINNALRPVFKQHMLDLKEDLTIDFAFDEATELTIKNERTAKNYTLTGDLYSLPYTEEKFIQNNKASTFTNLNPYNVVSFKGKITGKSSDIWKQEINGAEIRPGVDTSDYDYLLSEYRQQDAADGVVDGYIWGEEIVGSVDLRNGVEYIIGQHGTAYDVGYDDIENVERVSTETVISQMRDVSIPFQASGLMPDTRVFVFFNGINVTENTRYTGDFATRVQPQDAYDNPGDGAYLASTIEAIGGVVGKSLVTDSDGELHATFEYAASKYNLPTGVYTLRITDDPTNNPENEFTSASMQFNSSGKLVTWQNKIITTRVPRVSEQAIQKSSTRVDWTDQGEIADKYCQGHDLYGTYHDGNGGYFDQLIETNNVATCQYEEDSVVQGCPTAGTVLDTFCDHKSGELKQLIAGGPDVNGVCTTSVVVKEANSPGCIPPNPCEGNGVIKNTFCVDGSAQNSKDLWGEYYDGTYNYVTGICGTYTALIDANNVEDCQSRDPCPVSGTLVSGQATDCRLPFTEYRSYHDGNCGTYEIVYALNSADCGYVDTATLEQAIVDGDTTITQKELDLAEAYDPNDAPALNTHLRFECYGADYYEILADGNWGESAVLIEANSSYYCDYHEEKDTVVIYTFHDLDEDDDDDGDLDPPRSQNNDTLGYMGAVFSYAFGRPPTESEREEIEAYAEHKGLTVQDFIDAETSTEPLAGGGIDGSIVPSEYNEAAAKVGHFVQDMVNEGIARGIGADSDASITNYMNEKGTMPGGVSPGVFIGVQAAVAIANSDQLNPNGWAQKAVDVTLQNSIDNGTVY